MNPAAGDICHLSPAPGSVLFRLLSYCRVNIGIFPSVPTLPLFLAPRVPVPLPAGAAGAERGGGRVVPGGVRHAGPGGALRGLPPQRGAPLRPAGGVRDPRPGAADRADPHRHAVSRRGAPGRRQEALHAVLRPRVSCRGR